MDQYDDLLPVCLHETKAGAYVLLDRHNDLIAEFDGHMETSDCERIVQLINRKET